MPHNRSSYNDQTPPELDSQIATGQESRHDQHQWIVRSVNELKADNSRLNDRIDTVFTHISDTKNDNTLACAVSRIETTMSAVERQLVKLDGIDTKLGEHSTLLHSADRQLSQLTDMNTKLGDHSVLLAGLPEINKKLERLEDIETSISRVKWFFGGLGTLIAGCAAFSWWFFGEYLTKLLAALNQLVLK